jgi:hypothetical protein
MVLELFMISRYLCKTEENVQLPAVIDRKCFNVSIESLHLNHARSWDSSVGILTVYRLDDWGLIPSKGKIFPYSTLSRLALGSTQPPIQ